MYSMIKNYKIGQIFHLLSKSTFRIQWVVDRSLVINVVFLFAFAIYAKRFSRILYHFRNIAGASIRALTHSFSHKLIDSSAIFKKVASLHPIDSSRFYTCRVKTFLFNCTSNIIVDFDRVP